MRRCRCLPADSSSACSRSRSGPALVATRGTLASWQEIAAAAAETISRSDRETRLAQRSERINAINETSIRMLSCSEPNEVARLATSSAAMILEADHAILRLQDPTTRRYSIRSYFGAAEGASAGDRSSASTRRSPSPRSAGARRT